MHPIFAEFVENCQSAVPTNDACTFANALRETVLGDYDSEKDVAEAAREIIMDYFGLDPIMIVIQGSVSKGSCRVNSQLILNLETKVQSGTGCDPSMENLATYIKQLPESISGQLPCLLLDITGPLLGIYGVMNTNDENIICEPLCPILPLHEVDNPIISPLVFRVCTALLIATKSLKNSANAETMRELSIFPYKTNVQVDGASINFRYVERITRYVFIVECTGADGSTYKAIAKFANKYGRDVHEYCATHGFAPKLLAFEELPASWNFILMEKLDLELISRMDYNEMRQQVRSIQQCLRDGNFVHGDLRCSNIFWYRQENKVILIDFDWSGTNGIKRYPCNMNPDISWPRTAATGNFLSFDHDAYWIEQLVGCRR